MTFLTKTDGMTWNEAKEILELHELVAYSLMNGPVPLSVYVTVRRVKSDVIEHQERNVRRFVARLKGLGYRVETHGDAEKLAVDFGSDTALRSAVEREIDQATARCSSDNNSQQSGEDEDDEERPLDAVAQAHALGLDVRRLCRRFNVSPNKALLILRAKGIEPRHVGRPSVEELRDVEVLRMALEAPKGYGYVTGVARALGCDRTTVYRLLRRLRTSGVTDNQ